MVGFKTRLKYLRIGFACLFTARPASEGVDAALCVSSSFLMSAGDDVEAVTEGDSADIMARPGSRVGWVGEWGIVIRFFR
jgi:hypothetical protein